MVATSLNRQLRQFWVASVLGLLLLFVLPWPPYWLQRRADALPGYAEWQSMGMDHGPWHGEPSGLLLSLSLMGLLAGFLALPIVGLLAALKRRDLRFVWVGIAAGTACCAGFIVQSRSLFWLID